MKLSLKTILCPTCFMQQNDRGQVKCTTIRCSHVFERASSSPAPAPVSVAVITGQSSPRFRPA